MSIEVLLRRGASIKAIAATTGLARNTVRKYARAGGQEVPRKPYKKRPTILVLERAQDHAIPRHLAAISRRFASSSRSRLLIRVHSCM